MPYSRTRALLKKMREEREKAAGALSPDEIELEELEHEKKQELSKAYEHAKDAEKSKVMGSSMTAARSEGARDRAEARAIDIGAMKRKIRMRKGQKEN